MRLSSYRGSAAVLLVFYPSAFTGICAGELNALQQHVDDLRGRGVVVLAASVDSKFSQRVFAEREGLTYPLLADFWPHGSVADRYGVLSHETGLAARATFLIDREGVVRWSVVSGPGVARELAAYFAAVAEL